MTTTPRLTQENFETLAMILGQSAGQSVVDLFLAEGLSEQAARDALRKAVASVWINGEPVLPEYPE
jgi:hypothetical protein